ncbi:MAG TPA: hypothetical protein VNO31_33780, partial [Umezawaea sp.]|nr:hypothetical protein [Umezawaea sp.]
MPATPANTITPRRAIKNYQIKGLINLRYVALRMGRDDGDKVPVVDAAEWPFLGRGLRNTAQRRVPDPVFLEWHNMRPNRAGAHVPAVQHTRHFPLDEWHNMRPNRAGAHVPAVQ